MGLPLRQGRHLALSGSCTMNQRKLKVSFHYNCTSSKADHPGKGSWTQQMRPDYTLTLWPEAFSEEEAERQELIVHIHFDAKYKVAAQRFAISLMKTIRRKNLRILILFLFKSRKIG